MTRELRRRIESGEWDDSILVFATADHVRRRGGARELEMYCQRAAIGADDVATDTVHVYGYVRPTETAWCQWWEIAATSVTRVVH